MQLLTSYKLVVIIRKDSHLICFEHGVTGFQILRFVFKLFLLFLTNVYFVVF